MDARRLVIRVRDWARRRLPAELLGILLCIAAASAPLSQFVRELANVGFLDWDIQLAYRGPSIISLARYGEAPWWNPWLCGGYPNWAYPEGATNIVSPFLPLYLFAPAHTAIRFEPIAAMALGIVFTYRLASLYVSRLSLRCIVTLLYMLNSRWFLQVGSGHMWYLSYLWTPLAVLFFEKCLRSGRVAYAFATGAVLALMLYGGGIYPLPHTVLLLAVLTILRSANERTLRPIAAFALCGVGAVGLAAPKLLPLLTWISMGGRPIDSEEQYGIPQLIAALTHPAQSLVSDAPAPMPYGNWWWESGIFVGWLGLLFLAIGVAWARDAEARQWRLAGLIFFALAAGAFHELSPWSLLHRLPLFSAHHVPIRFLTIGVLALGIAAARAIELRWPTPTAKWVCSAGAVAIAIQLATAAFPLLEPVFKLKPPAVTRAEVFRHSSMPRFHFERPTRAGAAIDFTYDMPYWEGSPHGSTYMSVLANEGVAKCYGIPVVPRSRVDTARGAPLFRLLGPGKVELERWKPSSAIARVSDVESESIVVYNMNYMRGWRANGSPAFAHDGLVAAKVTHSGPVEFRFTPPYFWWGVAAFAAIVGVWVRFRRAELPRGEL